MRERQAQALKKDAELKANAITVPRARAGARAPARALRRCCSVRVLGGALECAVRR